MNLYRITKRAFDIIASALGLVVTSPVWLAAAIGIELSDQYFDTATKRIQEAEDELLNDF